MSWVVIDMVIVMIMIISYWRSQVSSFLSPLNTRTAALRTRNSSRQKQEQATTSVQRPLRPLLPAPAPQVQRSLLPAPQVQQATVSMAINRTKRKINDTATVHPLQKKRRFTNTTVLRHDLILDHAVSRPPPTAVTRFIHIGSEVILIMVFVTWDVVEMCITIGRGIYVQREIRGLIGLRLSELAAGALTPL
jgi:hypothetical protein